MATVNLCPVCDHLLQFKPNSATSDCGCLVRCWKCMCGTKAWPLDDNTSCQCKDYYDQEWSEEYEPNVLKHKESRPEPHWRNPETGQVECECCSENEKAQAMLSRVHNKILSAHIRAIHSLWHRHNDGSNERFWAEWDDVKEILDV